MNIKLLNDYAKLVVQIGARVSKGEEVIINANLDQPEFVTMVVEECYLAGAKKVNVNWNYNPVSKVKYKYETVSSLGNVGPIEIAKQKYYTKKLPTFIHIISDDPDAFKGINGKKIAKSRIKQLTKTKKYRDLRDGKYKWVIAAVPGEKWAQKVFPKLKIEDAIEKLWELILSCCRVDGFNAVENWNKHNEILLSQRKKLKDLEIIKLHYSSKNGTNFDVYLNPEVMWGGGAEICPNKGLYNPNIPSEEVFTTPIRGKCEGILVASKPLSYNGSIIEDFSLTFKDGKVVSIHAKKGEKILQEMVNMDEGSKMLGEVALVPFTSPINLCNTLFYETLFDENAVCHFAIGAGFRELYPNSENMTTEQLKQAGINDSNIHVDFMIGTQDLLIEATSKNGKITTIFKDGVWAI